MLGVGRIRELTGYGPASNTNVPPDATLALGTGRTARRIAGRLYGGFAVLDNGSLVSWGADPWNRGSLGPW